MKMKKISETALWVGAVCFLGYTVHSNRRPLLFKQSFFMLTLQVPHFSGYFLHDLCSCQSWIDSGCVIHLIFSFTLSHIVLERQVPQNYLEALWYNCTGCSLPVTLKI